MKALGATERIYELIHRKPLVNISGGKILMNLEGNVALNDVYFSYPSRPDHSVLNGMNLTLSPGKVLALVGTIGGGKSTVSSLLQVCFFKFIFFI